MNLSELLKALRKLKGYTLMDVEKATGISNAYLSQMENRKIKTPSAGFLYKLAKVYDVPYEMLMKAAGYIDTTEDVSNRLLGLAFSKTGNLSPDEVDKVYQFVTFLRESKPRANKGQKVRPISIANVHLELKKYASDIIGKAGLQKITPIPLEEILKITKLEKQGEEDLYAVVEDIYKKTGNWISSGLQKIMGMFDFTNKTVYVSPDIHKKKDRFVTLHEISHQVIPWHKELFYADDKYTLSFEADKKIEAEANELAAHFLFGVDRFTKEAADYTLSLAAAKILAEKYDSSYHSAFRRYVETHDKPCALVIYRIDKGGIDIFSRNEISLEYQYAVKSGKFLKKYDYMLPELIEKRLSEYIYEFDAEDLLSNEKELSGIIYIQEPITNKNIEFNCQSWGNYYNLFVLIFPISAVRSKKIAVFSH